MISKKLENFCFVIVFLILNLLGTTIQNYFFANLHFLNISRIIIALAMTFVLYWVYLNLRNKKCVNQIYNYSINHTASECLVFIEKRIKKQPKLLWLEIVRTIFLAKSGKFAEFYSEYEMLKNIKAIRKVGFYYRLEVIKQAVDCMFEGSVGKLENESKEELWNKYIVFNYLHMYNAVNSYINENYDLAIKCAVNLYETSDEFEKCVSSFILTKAFFKIDKVDESNKYDEYLKKSELYKKIKGGN